MKRFILRTGIIAMIVVVFVSRISLTEMKHRAAVGISGSPSSYRGIIDYLRNEKRFDESEIYLKEALKKYPGNIDFLYLLANQMRNTPDRYSEAEKIIHAGIVANEHIQRVEVLWEQLGKLYVTEKRYPEAEYAFGKGILLNPKNNQYDGPFFQLILLYENMDRTDEAIAALSRRITELPDPILYTQKARLETALGNKKEAESVLREGVARFPTDKALRQTLARFYYKQDIIQSKSDPVK